MNPIKHVAIIMDGNGRWGIKHKNSRNAGHRAGLNSVEKIINEFALLRNQWLGITKGLDQKQWQITNIVKLRVAGMEDATIK